MAIKHILIVLTLAISLSACGGSDGTNNADAIRVGVISEHNLWAQMAEGQNKGVRLAVAQINAAGGVCLQPDDCRPLEVLYRKGGSGTPSDVLRDVDELVQRENVRLLLGTGPDNTGLAVSEYAKRHEIFFLKGINGTNKHIWQEGHKYAFRFDVPNYMYGEVFADAAAETGVRKWALVAPDYEFGRSVVADFKGSLKKEIPETEFVHTQWFPTGKIQAGMVAQAVAHAAPDGIFFAGFGGDAVEFLRQGRKRGLFENRTVIGVLTGQPEQLEAMGAEAPEGWITQGYPYADITTPAHKSFLQAYGAEYDENPGWFAFVGYNMMQSLAAALEEAGSTDPDAVAEALKGLTVATTAGPITYRAADNQSNLGLWVGKVGFTPDGTPTLVDWQYKPGDTYYPGDAYVKTVRQEEE